MNKFSMKKLLSILLCIALIAALALSTVGCSKNDKTEPVASAEASGGTVSMGEGETMFLFNVVDPEARRAILKSTPMRRPLARRCCPWV